MHMRSPTAWNIACMELTSMSPVSKFGSEMAWTIHVHHTRAAEYYDWSTCMDRWNRLLSRAASADFVHCHSKLHNKRPLAGSLKRFPLSPWYSMRRLNIALALVCVAAAARLSDLPKCAIECFREQLEAYSCDGPEDIECLCKYVSPTPFRLWYPYLKWKRCDKFEEDIYPCVEAFCGLKDL